MAGQLCSLSLKLLSLMSLFPKSNVRSSRLGDRWGGGIRNETNFTRSYTSTDGCLVKISTLIHSILAVQSSPGVPAAGPKCAMAGDCVSDSTRSSKKRRSLLPAMAQRGDWGKWRVVGWRENNIIKDLVHINDIRKKWVCCFGTHHLPQIFCYPIILKTRKVRLRTCFNYPSSIWWALTTVKEPRTLRRHDR